MAENSSSTFTSTGYKKPIRLWYLFFIGLTIVGIIFVLSFIGDILPLNVLSNQFDEATTVPQINDNKSIVERNQEITSQEEKICIPDWECSQWYECNSSGTQTRTCTDNNNCNLINGKPIESQSCTPEIVKTKSLGPFEINIIGDSDCITKTNQALELLKNKAPVHYDVIIKYVAIIECSESGSGMYAWEDPPRYKVGKETIDAGTIWYSGTIAHDACHSKQYHDYLLNNPSKSVPSSVYTGKNAEAQCLDVQYDALSKIGATQGTLDYITHIIDSEYWNVKYSDRWW